MPGAFMLNNWTGSYDPRLNQGIGSGNDFTGAGANWGVGSPEYDAYAKTYGKASADAIANHGAAIGGYGQQAAQGTGGGYNPYAIDGGGGATSLATGGSVPGGGYQYQNQLNQIRDDFRRMTEKGMGALNEDLNSRGIFSSGVGAKLGSDYRTQMGQQELSAEERLLNDIMGHNFQMDMMNRQFQLDRMKGGGGGAQRFGNAGQNADLMAMFQQAMGQGGGGMGVGQPQTFQGNIGQMFGGGGISGVPQGLIDSFSQPFGSNPMPTPLSGASLDGGSSPDIDAIMQGLMQQGLY